MRHEKMYEFESVEVKPGTTKLIELHAPSLDYGLANLEVHGYRGIISKDSALIQIRSEEYWVIIQTNKFKYKPGELVQFRLICIDQLTRPSKLNQNITVKIFDGQHNTLKSLSDVELVQGVYKGEFQISKNPVLGIWKIRATSDSIFTDKNFEVDRYALPKFNVDIKASIIATEKDQVQLEVSANYFHGEPVKGNLTIILTNTELPSMHYYMPYVPTLTRDLEINGSTTIILDLKNDLKFEFGKNKDQGPLNPYSLKLGSYKFNVEAFVIDELSEEKSWAETKLEIPSEPYYIELEAPDQFESDAIIKIKV
ncbi:CD109 antigen-like [Episyrphus balteatus]|uniref:CD109 antigen-like n=1 Tax=Episyrphus balteatus TaxID=286459 RepID=UPI0024851EB7|nr:CD109 antigen-like [Episyrphus balteatus]